jgi:hypothetical protein
MLSQKLLITELFVQLLLSLFARIQSVRDVRLNNIPANTILYKPSSPALLPEGEGSRISKSRFPRERDLGRGPAVCYSFACPLLLLRSYGSN